MDHTPTVPISRPDLIAALCGDDLEPTPCRTCRGSGYLTIGDGRGTLRTCPMCRGKGERVHPAPAPGPF